MCRAILTLHRRPPKITCRFLVDWNHILTEQQPWVLIDSHFKAHLKLTRATVTKEEEKIET